MDVADMYYLYVATFRCQTDTSDEWFIWQVPVVGDMDATSTAQMAQAWLLGQEVTESDGAPKEGKIVRAINKEIEVAAGPIPLVTPAVAADTMMKFGISLTIKDGEEVTDLPPGSAGPDPDEDQDATDPDADATK